MSNIFVECSKMVSNFVGTSKSRTRSSSPLKKIKRFFKSGSTNREYRKDSDDIGYITERSYYHVNTQKLYPRSPYSEELGNGGESIEERAYDTDSIQYSGEQDSSDNYDMSKVNRNPIYRSQDDIQNEHRFRTREVYYFFL